MSTRSVSLRASLAKAGADRDAEDCGACADLQDVCQFHRGVAAGVEAFAARLRVISEDPDVLNELITAPMGATS